MKKFGKKDSIVVVDNNSDDNSYIQIEEFIASTSEIAKIRLLRAPKNGGFAYGNNLGITSSDSDYVVLINSDALLVGHAIEKLFIQAEKNPQYGILSPRLEWPDEEPQVSCFRYLSPVSEFLEAARTGPLSRWLKSYSVPVCISNVPTEPQWTSFACVLIRREVFADVGWLDEGFFMYFEDVEFCHRAREAGWKILNVPGAHVIHLRGGSSSVKSDQKLRKRLPRYFYASRTRYFYLIYGRTGLLLANVLWSAGRTVSKMREWIERRETHIPDEQWRDIWINWSDPLQGNPPVKPVISSKK